MQEAQQAQPIAGVFTPRLVARLHLEGFDGSVRFSTATVTRVIYFRRGEIASAASNADADRLPTILIGDGRLTQPQLEMARSRLRPGVSLGKMLIELGFLTPSELLQGARRQVRQILAACFAQTEGAYQISPGPLPREITVLGLPARRLIFDALLEAGDRQTIVREMGSMESVYRPAVDFHVGLASLKLDPSIEQVGLAVDGRRTLRDISSQTSLDDFAVSKVVLALEILGLTEADRPAPPSAAAAQGRRIPIASETTGEEDSRPSTPQERAPATPASAGRSEAPVAPAAPPNPATPTEEADWPPPIPPGELPAFAAPSDETPEWRLDPETGGRTLRGPVEMTFDGPLAPASPRPSAVRRWGAIVSVTAAILAAGFVAGFLRSRVSSRPEVATAVPVRSAPAKPETTPTREPDAATSRSEGSEAPPAPAPPLQARRGPAPEEDRIAGARRLIDEGRIDEAVRTFGSFVREVGADRFTLQVMIACEPATVQKALAATRPESSLIVLPFPLQGRACYRACWGVYDSKDEARAAASSLPAYFAEAARQPVVVSLARLAPP